MAHITSQVAAHTPLTQYLLAPFRAIWAALVHAAENSSYAKKIESLAAISDEELAWRGVTREEMLRDMFGGRYYL